MSFETLQQKSPWPTSPPDLPEDWHGWLWPDTAAALAAAVSAKTRLVIECGTWLGLSARHILLTAPATRLICIDTWQGSAEHHVAHRPDFLRRLQILHEQCQRNLWPWRDRVILLQADSLVGLAQVYAAELKPSLIYLDSAHTLSRVTAELALTWELFPDAAIVGDDHHWRDVHTAVNHHAALFRRNMIDHGNAYTFLPRSHT